VSIPLCSGDSDFEGTGVGVVYDSRLAAKARDFQEQVKVGTQPS